MIDRTARRRLAELLRRLAWGRITNDEFEDQCHPLFDSEDQAIQPFHSAAWGFYSDTEAYKLRGRNGLNRRQKKVFARMILFLHSDHEYLGPNFGPSKRQALGTIVSIGIAILLFKFSLVGSVIALSFAILFLAFRAFEIAIFGLVELAKWPRTTYRWLGLNRSFFLEHPTWPFGSFADYRTALRLPPYFAGALVRWKGGA